MRNKIKIAIVDDEQLIGDLLSCYYENHPRKSIIIRCHGGETLLNELSKLADQPDIVIMELKTMSENSLEFISYLKKNYSNLRVIVMTSLYDVKLIGTVFKAGASAFIPKGISLDHLNEIISNVNESGSYFMIEQIEVLKDQISSKTPKPKFTENDKISSREKDVLDLILKQYTTLEIAEKLFITKRTVEGHRSSLLLKTCAKNSVGLVIWAVQNRVIDINEYKMSYN